MSSSSNKKKTKTGSGQAAGGARGAAAAKHAEARADAIEQAEDIGGPLMLRVASCLRVVAATLGELERRVAGPAGGTIAGGRGGGSAGEDEAPVDLAKVFSQGLTFATDAARQVIIVFY